MTSPCEDGAVCWPQHRDDVVPTCKGFFYERLGEECRIRTDCWGLKCEPFSRTCQPDINSLDGYQCESLYSCLEGLICTTTINIDGTKYCIEPFSLSEGNTCDTEFENLIGDNGN
ncbi:hypothetical protein DFA_05240 [Cavenderia fasciculata]|uniref:Uncharacterized protein n=1 Tax=Cavenderia fasciculata TaxID=261658 RepID=F4PNQ7_CACFS|nr:uncharacterized protein DFA_05240 [Cavenderia fasciculata]EGG23110.1 hypothetical protein DFA_05240 [Cavenderia fasciculata]|eukprot:XP_004360961.1 hypothetical protein DFA_05240 [Cavenderia fasciculata]